jgi:glyoxylase-like metal-dependent hydrolase (beta-lactamase superfamily II)
MAPVLTAVTATVHLVRTELVNWTIVADGSGVLLIDAGFPGSRDDVLTSLRSLGFTSADVGAILLTHAHIDHLGAAIWFAKTHGTPVYCHPAEVAHAHRDYLEQASPAALMTQAWRPQWLRWSAQVAAKGALQRAGIPAARPLTAEIAATLPGRPRALPTPGHTSGHCSYVVDGVLVAGDALVTGHPLAQRHGPQLLPSVFNHSDDDCTRSLSVLATAGTEILIPGHGDVWTGPIADAARLAAQPAAT